MSAPPPQRLSDEKMDAMRDYFRAHGPPKKPADFREAADATGVDRRTIKKHWNRTIQYELAADKARSCAKLKKEVLAEEAALARQELETNEINLATTVRESAHGLLSRLQRLEPATNLLVRVVVQEVMDTDSMSAEKALSLLERIVKLMREAGSLGGDAIEMEREKLSDPRSVVNVQMNSFEMPSLVEAEQEVAGAFRALERMRAKKALSAPPEPDEQAH